MIISEQQRNSHRYKKLLATLVVLDFGQNKKEFAIGIREQSPRRRDKSNEKEE